MFSHQICETETEAHPFSDQVNIKVTIFLVQVPVQSSLMTQERSAVLTFCQQQRFHLSEKK